MVAIIGNSSRDRCLPTTPSTNRSRASITISQKFWNRPGTSLARRAPKANTSTNTMLAIQDDRRVLVMMKP